MAITTDLATSFLFSPLVLSRASRWLCWLIFLLRLLLPRKRRLVACTSRTPARRSPAPLVLRVRRDARPPGAVRRHAPAHAAAPIVAVDDVLQHLLQVLQRVRLLHGAGDGGGRASSVRKRVLVNERLVVAPTSFFTLSIITSISCMKSEKSWSSSSRGSKSPASYMAFFPLSDKTE